MTTIEIAQKLVQLCREGKEAEVHQTLFASDVQSIEANESMGPKVVTGIEGVKAKAIAFQASVEAFHGSLISDPIVAGNSFAITWAMDATFVGSGRVTIEEVCVYQVKDEKIILEQFFY